MDYMQQSSTKTASSAPLSQVELVHDKTLDRLFSSGEVLSFVETGDVVSITTSGHLLGSLSGLTSIAGGTDISYQVLKTVVPAILSYFEHDNFGNFEVRKSSTFYSAFHGTMQIALNRITHRLLVKSPQAILQELEATTYAEVTEDVVIEVTKKTSTNHCTFRSFNLSFVAFNFTEFDLLFETKETIQNRIDHFSFFGLTEDQNLVYQYNHAWVVYRMGPLVDGLSSVLGAISTRESVVDFNQFFEAGSAEEIANDTATMRSSNLEENEHDAKAIAQDRDRNPSRKGESQRLRRRQQKRKQKRDSKTVIASPAENAATTPNDGEAESSSIATSEANNPRESTTT